ncbi:type IVB secretion system protein IcmH/DotU [Trinickia sp.]|uniref:type IVB secretion system protein IcmH/DotU n=1 Tax=Trinickia sp. TaxID=2571163 RepID=UPI003F80BE9F
MNAVWFDPAGATPAREPRERNRLLEAARPLLELACRLRTREFEEALEPLRDRLRTMVDAFDAAARHAGVGGTAATSARYCLCTFVDEIVAATPSGGAGAWASHSLLVLFHGETSGGERFFSLLQDLARDAGAHLEALELIDVMLALGMEGRYRLLNGGPSQLESVRTELRRLIVAERGTPPVWPDAMRGSEHLWRRGGRWKLSGAIVAGSLCAFVSLLVMLEANLHAQARPVIETLAQVRVAPVSQATVPAVSTSALADRLAQRLAADLSAGRLALERAPDRAVLTLGSDALFASGSAVVLPGRLALLQRVGLALRELDARIVVVGHTDDALPSPGKRSNWQLSLARASEVANLLRKEAGAPERFLAQGAGASAPVAPNDSPGNRARNRRVVITIVARGASL